MINFYKKFLYHAIDNQSPLLNMIKGNVKNDCRPGIWSTEIDAAFNKCKQTLANATLLAYPAKMLS